MLAVTISKFKVKLHESETLLIRERLPTNENRETTTMCGNVTRRVESHK